MNERRLMGAVGSLQGLALWLLYESWPEQVEWAAASVGLVYFISASALVIHLARTGREWSRLLGLAASVGVVFAAIAFWVGWQQSPEGASFEGDDTRVATWILGSAIAIYVLGPFIQIFQQSGRARFPYPELYRFSWNNLFVAALGLVYVLALWIVLLLWGQLFALIGIEFFEDLFAEAMFVYIVTGAAIGYGLAASRESERVIATLRGITQALLRAVLPVLSGVTVAFIVALPFTGLDSLFGATSAATVLICWLISGVLLLNAVYLDGSGAPPYGRALRWLVEAGVLVTPVLAGLALYALALRIGQHGLTPPRVYAFLLAVILSLYALGYAAAVVLRAGLWLAHVRVVNVWAAWVWIALALAVHTPLLDPLGWSLRDQLRRLEFGLVDAVEFDYGYLRFHLGRAGAEALARLATDEATPAAARVRLELARSSECRRARAGPTGSKRLSGNRSAATGS